MDSKPRRDVLAVVTFEGSFVELLSGDWPDDIGSQFLALTPEDEDHFTLSLVNQSELNELALYTNTTGELYRGVKLPLFMRAAVDQHNGKLIDVYTFMPIVEAGVWSYSKWRNELEFDHITQLAFAAMLLEEFNSMLTYGDIPRKGSNA